MKKIFSFCLGVLLLAVGISTANADSPLKLATEKHNLTLEYRRGYVLNLWNKPADENSGKPAMVFENGWEPEGVLPDGTNCVHRIEFFSGSSMAEQVATLSYYNTNPKCGDVVQPKDGSIGILYYRNSRSQQVKEVIYRR